MKIRYTFLNPSQDIVEGNRTINRARAYPALGCRPVKQDLAVVAGGPSIIDRLDELRAFDGEVWAINGAWRWCAERGIDAALFSMEAAPALVDMAHGATYAVLPDLADPRVFDTVGHDRCEMFDTSGEWFVSAGGTSAGAAPIVGFTRGHRHITFYGCESSFAIGQQRHAYANDVLHGQILEVRSNGQTFYTSPDLFGQAEALAEIIRGAPEAFAERSGGLLGAMVVSGDHDITAASRSVHEDLGLL